MSVALNATSGLRIVCTHKEHCVDRSLKRGFPYLGHRLDQLVGQQVLQKACPARPQRARRRIVLCPVRWASERRENDAGGLFQQAAQHFCRMGPNVSHLSSVEDKCCSSVLYDSLGKHASRRINTRGIGIALFWIGKRLLTRLLGFKGSG